MKGAVLLLVLSGTTSFASAEAPSTNPLAKVLTLLDDLAAKISKAGEAEEKAYAEFVEWCDDAATNTKFEIKTSTANKAKLEARILKLADDSSAADTKIEELAGSIAADTKDLNDATLIRQKEAADFAAEEAELADGIDTLGRAISIIGREMAKNPAAFAQAKASNLNSALKALGAVLDAAAFSNADRKRLDALLQAQQQQSGAADDDDFSFGAPAAAAYKSHSSNIVDVLEDMKEKAEEELSSLRKAETNAKNNYEMLKQSLKDQIAADNKDMDDEKEAKAAAEESTALAKGDLTATIKELADADTRLDTAQTDCMSTATNHEVSKKARAEELKVIAEAKKILVESTSGAESQTYSFLQSNSNSAVATGSLLRTRTDLAGAEVVTLVNKLAKEHHSEALAQLASRISAVMRYGTANGEDPFVKVRALITDLITKLEKEAATDADEKAYCDEQIAKTEEKKNELDFDISKLTSKIDQASAASAALKEDVKELQASLAKMAKEQAEMDGIRSTAHAEYVQAKKDLELGLTGVRGALNMLKDYYGNTAALLQSSAALGEAMAQPAVPEYHSKAGGAGSSIIGMLEVVESDFAKSLAVEETEESDAEAEYQKVTQENKVATTMKTQDVKYKTQEFIGLDKTIADITSDRETATSELAAVNSYYALIKDRCLAKPESYEARKARRTAEINGLKEALTILEGETAFVQHGKRSRHNRFLGFAQ